MLGLWNLIDVLWIVDCELLHQFPIFFKKNENSLPSESLHFHIEFVWI